jgi:5S rRNA maturation endonuclease (ribonuclease M5)
MTVDEFISRLEGVMPSGQGYACRCPAHEDRNASLSVCEGEGGRVLVKCHAGCVVKDVVGTMGLSMKDLMPAKEEATRTRKVGVVVARYPYFDADGNELYRVLRYEPKDFRPQMPNGKMGLNGTPRVLFRLPQVIEAVKAGRTIYVVEGEKDALALEGIGLAATTNCGGASWKWTKEFAEPLRGANVVIIADADEPGRKHGRQVAGVLDGLAASVMVVEVTEGKDASDFLATGKGREDIEALRPASKPEPPAPRDGESEYWKAAGHDCGVYYVFLKKSGQLRHFKGAVGVRNALLEMAPLSEWIATNPNEDGDGIAKDGATNHVIESCMKAGLFDPNIVRSVGSWPDEGRVVFNSGSCLYVVKDGKPEKVEGDFSSRYIYEMHPQAVKVGRVMTGEERALLSKAVRLLNWRVGLMADFVLGWLVIAVLAGVTRWRPHLFLTGESGAGKSTLLHKFVLRILSGFIIARQGTTTEASFRGLIGHSSRPCAFDEAERNNNRGEARVSGVTELARASSSGDGTPISRSNPEGQVRNFTCQSAFIFSAIGSGFELKADMSRFTEVELMPHGTKEAFEQFENIMAGFGKDLPANFIATSLAYAPYFEVNHAKLIAALEKRMPRRSADQLGMTLAASLMFESQWRELTPEQATALAACIVEEMPVETSETVTDQSACLTMLQESDIALSSGQKIKVQQAIERAYMATESDEYKTLLKWNGIMCETDAVVVKESHKFLMSVFKDTQFDKKWTGYLRRIKGAVARVNVRWNAGGGPQKGTRIPLEFFIEEQQP